MRSTLADVLVCLCPSSDKRVGEMHVPAMYALSQSCSKEAPVGKFSISVQEMEADRSRVQGFVSRRSDKIRREVYWIGRHDHHCGYCSTAPVCFESWLS